MNQVVANSSYKIAVIEDDLTIRNLYQTKLELSGFTVRTATNGLEGFDLVKSYQPDLILLDILMPQQNGDEMLARIREHEWGASVRVVVLTNISRDEAPSVLRLLNVDRYIVKAHYTPSQVIDVVRQTLNIR